MKIVNFGSCNLDYVYKLDHIVAGGETEHSLTREVFPGGKGLNQSIAIARAGAKVCHAGCIGKDGEILRQVFAESGVDLTYLQTLEQPSGHAVIQVDGKGENAIFICAGANGCFTLPYVDRVLADFGEGDILLLQNEINNNAYVIDRAYEKGMCILLNPSPIDEAIRKTDFGKISCLLLNQIEGEALSGEKQPAKIIARFRETYPRLKVVLTLGEKGCLYFDGSETVYQPAFAVETVDSTAAGDTFTGYFAASLSMGLPSRKILEWASAAAALAVSKKGAAPSIPRREEVAEALRQLTPRESDGESRLSLQKKRIDAYVAAHLQTADLKGLASELGYSAVYAGALCKKATGFSFSKYLMEKRCQAAAELLQTGSLPVGEIVEKVGYCNQSYFRSAFREAYGVSPAAYRKMMKKK